MSEPLRVVPLALGTRLTLRAGCVLVEDGAERVLVDPGCFATRAELEQALRAQAGIGVADVTVLFFTHLHFDHYADLGFADVPRVLLPRREVEAARELARLRGDAQAFQARIQAMHERVAPVFMRQFVSLRDDPRYDFERVSFGARMELAEPGDRPTPGLRAIDLAGHSVGQLGLELHSRHGRTAIAADAALSAEDFAQPGIAHHLVVHDAPALLATRARLARFDCVIPGHGAWFDPRTLRQLPAQQKEDCHV